MPELTIEALVECNKSNDEQQTQFLCRNCQLSFQKSNDFLTHFKNCPFNDKLIECPLKSCKEAYSSELQDVMDLHLKINHDYPDSTRNVSFEDKSEKTFDLVEDQDSLEDMRDVHNF